MRKIKNIFTYTCIIMIVLINFSVTYADDMEENEENFNVEEIKNSQIEEVSKQVDQTPTINSRRYIIYDRKSKTTIYGRNENVKTAMASTTKIMTATIILENCNLTDVVTVSSKAAGTGGSRLGLKKGDKVTINDLLYGLMLRSGNDAAVALAEYAGNSVQGFNELMNKKVEELGLKCTHFVTPHGLDDSEHYTTAYELAVLTDYALENDKFAQIVGTKSTTITINGYSKQINNTNELLGVINGVVGVKTGFTNNAGRCLVSETKRDDMDIITIVLGADTKKDRTKDSIKLIEYAFENYKMVNIAENIVQEFNNWKQINEKRIKIVKGIEDNLNLSLGEIKIEEIALNKNLIDNIAYEINTITSIEAPVFQWTKIGTINVKSDNKIIQTIDIINTKQIKKKTWVDYLKLNLKVIKNAEFLNSKSLTET